MGARGPAVAPLTLGIRPLARRGARAASPSAELGRACRSDRDIKRISNGLIGRQIGTFLDRARIEERARR